MIQEPTMKDNPLVVMCSACGVGVIKATIQISEGAIFFITGKRQAAFVTTVIPFDI